MSLIKPGINEQTRNDENDQGKDIKGPCDGLTPETWSAATTRWSRNN